MPKTAKPCIPLSRTWLIICLAAVLPFSGCSYSLHRGRDAVDMITMTLVGGMGITAQIGPVVNGIGANDSLRGIEDGIAYQGRGSSEWALILASGKGNLGDLSEWAVSSGKRRGIGNREIVSKRHKSYETDRTFGIFGSKSPKSMLEGAHFWTKIEIAVSLGVGIKLGTNPGEILDFILGFTTLDVYGDDVDFGSKDPASEIPQMKNDDLNQEPNPIPTVP